MSYICETCGRVRHDCGCMDDLPEDLAFDEAEGGTHPTTDKRKS